MDEITRTQRRTQAYWFADGIAEVVGGIALAAVGAALAASVRLDEQGFSTLALGGMILAFPLSAKIVRILKDRITHQRTGYVKFPAPNQSRRRRGLLVGVAVAVALVTMALLQGDYSFSGDLGRAMFLGAGIAVGAAFLVRAWKMSMPRFYLTGLASLGVVAAAGMADIGLVEGLGWLWVVVGTVSVLTGLIALLDYLRQHPRMEANPR